MSEPTKIDEIIDDKLDTLKNESSDDTSQPKHGGARENAGRPKGSKNKATLEQQKVKEAFNQRVMLHADRLFNAQMNLAVGEQVLMVKVTERNSKGNVIRTYHEQVTDVELIKQYLDYEEGINDTESPDDENNFYYLTTKSANNQAIDSLLNRALGKAPDKIEVEGGFFNQPELTIKVVGSNHDDIHIGEDGQVAEFRDGEQPDTDTERETRPSGQAS